MAIRVNELRKAEFIGEQENGFGLINRPKKIWSVQALPSGRMVSTF
jgi:hypothetical protein